MSAPKCSNAASRPSASHLPWRIPIVSFIAAFLGLPQQSYAQVFWKDARVGMSVEAVQRQFPLATRPSTSTTLRDGSQELLRLSDISTQGHTFDALFFFKGKKLTQISLELQEEGGAVFALQTFRGIKAAYDSKYGPPDDEQDHHFDAPTGPASFRLTSWRAGRTLITLSYATAAGQMQVLNIAYRLAPDFKMEDI